jgi:hypothetical protein
MKVFLDINAKDAIGKYYEGYGYLPTGGTDLEQRSNNYRKMMYILGNIEQYANQTYMDNDKNFIIIDNIATVEYEILSAKGLLAVKNIYFKNNRTGQNI